MRSFVSLALGLAIVLPSATAMAQPTSCPVSTTVARGSLEYRCTIDDDPDACDELARGPDLQLACAYHYYSKICTATESRGCARKGRALLLGRGVPKDVAAGRELLERACDDGDCMDMFLLQERKEWPGPNDIEARRTAAFGACATTTDACEVLERSLERCKGTRAARPERCAIARAIDACNRGKPSSCIIVGESYAKGGPVLPSNTMRALDYFDRACTDGRSCLATGDAVSRIDIRAAPPFYYRACKFGNRRACTEKKSRNQGCDIFRPESE